MCHHSAEQMNRILISRSYSRALGIGTDLFISTRHFISSHSAKEWYPDSTCYLKPVRLLPRQTMLSHFPRLVQYHCRPTIFPEASSGTWNRLRNKYMLMDRRSNCGFTLRAVREENLITLKRTFIAHERGRTGRAYSKEDRVKKQGSSEDNSFTTPLNQKATKAIFSQLSSPPNLLTMTRILATPYLSYMLISDNRKRNIPSSTDVEEETVVAAASSPSETVDATIDFSADALSTLFANLDLLSTPEIALVLFLLMGFTDFLDGYIARAYPSTATVLGTYLDPFADKFFISIISMTLWYIGSLPGFLVGLWIARDVGIVGSVYWLVRKETIKMQSRKELDEQDSERNNVAVMDPQNTPLKVQASFASKVNTTLQIGLIALGIAGEVPSIEVPPMLMTSLVWITAGTTIGSSLGYLDGSAMKSARNKL